MDVKGDALIQDEAELLGLLGVSAAQLKQLPYPRGPMVVQVDPAKPDPFTPGLPGARRPLLEQEENTSTVPIEADFD